jgi:hypothetical protein
MALKTETRKERLENKRQLDRRALEIAEQSGLRVDPDRAQNYVRSVWEVISSYKHRSTDNKEGAERLRKAALAAEGAAMRLVEIPAWAREGLGKGFFPLDQHNGWQARFREVAAKLNSHADTLYVTGRPRNLAVSILVNDLVTLYEDFTGQAFSESDKIQSFRGTDYVTSMAALIAPDVESSLIARAMRPAREAHDSVANRKKTQTKTLKRRNESG